MPVEYWLVVGVEVLLLALVWMLYRRLRLVTDAQEHVESLLHDANVQLLQAGKELQGLARSVQEKEHLRQNQRDFAMRASPLATLECQRSETFSKEEDDEVDLEAIDRMLARGAKPEAIARSLGVPVDLVRLRMRLLSPGKL